ncbi:MAG TPA: DUF2905 domain-containing protein [Planctomycetota bacterium]|nr:DUF2905 domain-containing protein [Planctomycetota bacterium]
MDSLNVGKSLLVVGLLISALGGVVLVFGRVPFFGRLPGDIKVEGKDYTYYFPWVTCLAISVVVSLIFWIVARFK